MFGIGNAAVPKVKTEINGVNSIISEGTSTGGMNFVGSIKIAGTINGDLKGAEVKGGSGVVVEASGKIHGCVEAENVIIGGTVDGNIKAKSVYILPTAVITGTVNYEVIQIEPGAKIQGCLTYGSNHTPEIQPLQEAA